MAQFNLNQSGKEKGTSLEFVESIMLGQVGVQAGGPRTQPQSPYERAIERAGSRPVRSRFLPRRRPHEIASGSSGHQKEKVEAKEPTTPHVVEGEDRQHNAGQGEARTEAARTAEESRPAVPSTTSQQVSESQVNKMVPRIPLVRNIDEWLAVATPPSASHA